MKHRIIRDSAEKSNASSRKAQILYLAKHLTELTSINMPHACAQNTTRLKAGLQRAHLKTQHSGFDFSLIKNKFGIQIVSWHSLYCAPCGQKSSVLSSQRLAESHCNSLHMRYIFLFLVITWDKSNINTDSQADTLKAGQGSTVFQKMLIFQCCTQHWKMFRSGLLGWFGVFWWLFSFACLVCFVRVKLNGDFTLDCSSHMNTSIGSNKTQWHPFTMLISTPNILIYR